MYCQLININLYLNLFGTEQIDDCKKEIDSLTAQLRSMSSSRNGMSITQIRDSSEKVCGCDMLHMLLVIYLR